METCGMCRQIHHKLYPTVLPPNGTVFLCLKRWVQVLILILVFRLTLVEYLEWEGTEMRVRTLPLANFSRSLIIWIFISCVT